MRLELLRMSLACGLTAGMLMVGEAPQAAAVQCPGSGAVLQVKVKNDTSDTPTVRIQGGIVNATCASASGWYNTTCILAANTTTTCTVGHAGVNSGLWRHQISYDLGTAPSELEVEQFQKSVVNFHATQASTIEWSYFPKAIKVNRAGGDGPTFCPVNAPPAANSCDIRDAVHTAQPGNPGSGSDPILIMLAVSPGALNSGHILNQRANLTIDGTDGNGNPWMVADPAMAAAGKQDVFSRAIEFAPNSGFKIHNTNVTFRGLEVRQIVDPSIGVSNSIIEIGETGYGFRLVSSRINGTMVQDCDSFPNNCSHVGSGIKVLPRSLPLPPGEASLQVDNSEIHSSIFSGVDVQPYGRVEIRDSWLHNNYGGNVIARKPESLSITRSVVERAGLRASDDLGVVPSLAGVLVSQDNSGSPAATEFASHRSIYRNNLGGGVLGTGSGTTLRPADDIFCGNEASGLFAFQGIGTGAPVVNSGGGLAAIYNGMDGAWLPTHGVYAMPTTSPQYDFDFNSVFASNLNCGLFNASPTIEISAIGNQWRGTWDPNDPNDPSFFDDCESSGGGPVDTSFPERGDSSALSVDGSFPNNAMLGNQTVLIDGSFFNAIAGNPLANDPNEPDLCALGLDPSGEWNGQGTPQAASCCRDASRSNTCGDPIIGNCVQLTDALGTIYNLGVKAVSPRLLEVEMPSVTSVSCIGGSGETLRVTKLNNLGQEVTYAKTVCNPAAL